MSSKDVFLGEVNYGEEMNINLMVMKIIYKDSKKVVCNLADKTGEIKSTIQSSKNDLKEGFVIKVKGKKDNNLDIKTYELIEKYNVEDYLPTVKRDIEEIMKELEAYTEKYVLSEEGKALNNYFFKDEEFLEKFKRGIGGVSMHHNYIGGLAEHTLGVMRLTISICEEYNCDNKEIAVLGAKLHDIGKIYEMSYDGPFKYTLKGEMEGHIVIGVSMIDNAINQNKEFYSEHFIEKIKGCIVQHHGKLEYGSPKDMKMEEAFIINFADNIDATMNKIAKIKSISIDSGWTEYDRKLETRLYI